MPVPAGAPAVTEIRSFLPKSEITEYQRRRVWFPTWKASEANARGLCKATCGGIIRGVKWVWITVPLTAMRRISEIQIIVQNFQMILSCKNGDDFDSFQFRSNESSHHLLLPPPPNTQNGHTLADLRQPFSVNFHLHIHLRSTRDKNIICLVG